MVARPGPISLPLLAGQNQKVDERLLAPQEFTRISNAVQERDGRQLTRRGFVSYPVGLWAGAGGPGGVAPIRCVGDGDRFVGDSSVLPYWTSAYQADVRSRAQGQGADSGYSTAPLKSVGPGGVCSLIPERVIPVSGFRGGREQTSSVCDYSTPGEWLVTCNCDAGAINVIWRSRDTLEVIASDRQTLNGFGLGPSNLQNYTQCSVVCSTSTHETVVVAVALDGSVRFIYYSDPGNYGGTTVTSYTVQMNINENSNIDTCTLSTGSAFFVAALCTNPTGMRLVACNFTPPHTQQWNNVLFAPGAQYTMCSLDANASQNSIAWAAVSSDNAATSAILKVGTVTYTTGAFGPASAVLSFSSGTGPGIPFITHANNLGSLAPAYMVALTQMGNLAGPGNPVPAARVLGWNGVNTAALNQYAIYNHAAVAGRVMLNSADGYYQDSTFRRLLVPLMQTGESTLDSDTSFDPNRAVFLQNLGANPDGSGGWTYPMTGAAECGLLEINGEVGQATSPFISFYDGVSFPSMRGWTMGAPTKLVRIASNSGDIDTGLTGAYVMTFDVATEGKSRPFNGSMGRQPLLNMPRQGRLAIFKPMRATECELAPIRHNETLIPGLTTTVADAVQTHSCGFLEAPVINSLGKVTSAVHPPANGTYYVTAVYEWTDSEGRRYQSAPAVPQMVTLAGTEQAQIVFNSPTACYSGASIAIYRTVCNGSEFKRDGSIDGAAVMISNVIFQLTDPQLLSQETLYTSLGEVPNDPPPGAQRFARTRDRVWAYGLDRREVIQASKSLQDGRGIVWSNAANFFVVMPEEVVAVETLDETAVVFTSNGVYTIGGAGPDDSGTGTFQEPGRIPGYVGCASAKSVISGDAGIYFLSQRGIELLPRGFGPPQWVGQPVMTDLASYTECRGAVADVESDQLIWSFVNPTTWEERLVVLNIRNQTWAAWDVPKTGPFSALNSQVPSVGVTVGGDNLTRGATVPKRPILWADTSARVRIQDPISAVDAFQTPGGSPNSSVVSGLWQSGWMRFAGTSGWQIIRRMSLTITPLLDPWTLALNLYFNDDPITTYSCSWNFSAITYNAGQSVTLSVNLPVVQFESLRYQLTASSSDAVASANGPALYVHSVMLHPESEGPRLPKENRR